MKLILILVITILLSSCYTYRDAKSIKTTSDEEIYTLALQNSCIPLETKIYKNLTRITADNQELIRKTINNEEYILTVSLKSEKAKNWYKNNESGFYNTGNYQIWVTVAPELQKKIKDLNPADKKLRLKQLLGLPPNAEYAYIIEFWVKPADLFRPCPDKEITDSYCELEFPANVSPEYKKWFNDSRIDRYFTGASIFSKYPWTQLGYTYDWSLTNTSHIGMSEFVIDTNKNVIVGNIFTIDEYFK